MVNKLRKVTKKEKEIMNNRAKRLIEMRGEIIHWMTEIESELDELIVYNYIKKSEKSHFFEILLWEDFTLSTKRRLFENINLPNNLKDVQKSLVKKLEKLASIRNKFAHRLSLINLNQTGLIDKGHKFYKVDNKTFNKFKNDAINALAKLRYILLIQNGIEPKSISKKSYWIKIKDIKD